MKIRDAKVEADVVRLRWITRLQEQGATGCADTLLQLGSNPDPDVLEKALKRLNRCGLPMIVHRSFQCAECKKDFPILIEVGEEPTFGSDTVWMCQECLGKASRMLQEAISPSTLAALSS